MVFSTLYQWGWVSKFLTADKLPIAVGIFLLFPIFSVIALALGNAGIDLTMEAVRKLDEKTLAGGARPPAPAAATPATAK